MKLLLDMGVSPTTGDHLRARGHDVVHVRDVDKRMPDEHILLLATREARTIVTFDLDFSSLLALQRLRMPSVIIFRLTEFTTEQVNDWLDHALVARAAELDSGAIVVVEPDRIRTRILPIT